jgi:hypothetical protein
MSEDKNITKEKIQNTDFEKQRNEHIVMLNRPSIQHLCNKLTTTAIPNRYRKPHETPCEHLTPLQISAQKF